MEGNRLFALCRCGLSRPIVAVMQATPSRLRESSARNYRANPAARRFLLESEMSAIVVVIANIIGKQSLQMGSVQGDHMIQQIPAAALDPALSNSILPRALP